MTTPARIVGALCRDLNAVCERVDACNAHLAYLDEITPARGEQRDEYEALCKHVQWMHDALCTLDENLVDAYRELDNLERVAIPTQNGESEVHATTHRARMQATRVGVDAPGTEPTSSEDVTRMTCNKSLHRSHLRVVET